LQAVASSAGAWIKTLMQQQLQLHVLQCTSVRASCVYNTASALFLAPAFALERRFAFARVFGRGAPFGATERNCGGNCGGNCKQQCKT
jgi:hypothetical protein